MQKKHNGFALVCCLFARTHLRYTPHLCILYAPPIYTIRPTPLYHTPYSFIPHAPPIYTIRPTHLYDIPYHLYTIHPPLYAKKIINKAAKAR